MTKKDFAETIETFLEKHKMAPTTFGILANKEPNFVFLIRDGRECREETQARILNFMQQYKENSDEETSC